MLEIGGNQKNAFVAGIITPGSNLDKLTLDGVILADIATAQDLTNREGWLDRIDLILPPGNEVIRQQITSALPPGDHLEAAGTSQDGLAQLTSAFQVNLTALSLLALVVGLFLIYNTMTFSVVQRRGLLGTLRSLGMTRREIFALVLGEAVIAGICGALLGVLLGIWMSQFTIKMVLQTVNDLYFTTTVRQVTISTASLVKGGLAGLVATILTVIPPAYEASTVPPRVAMTRSSLESSAHKTAYKAAWTGLFLIVGGGLSFLLPLHDLVSGFSATLAVVLGFALFAALGLKAFAWLVNPATHRLFGISGRMAPRNVVSSLSRTSVAVAALMVAVSVIIGVSLMVGSFRNTVVVWLAQTLQNDIYISAPSFTGTSPVNSIDPRILTRLTSFPGVSQVNLLRTTEINSPGGTIRVAATNDTLLGQERSFYSLNIPKAQVWHALQSGSVIISQPLAYRLNLSRQSHSIDLYTPQGLKSFSIAGIYYDYSSSAGIITMSLEVYRRIWDDNLVTAVGLQLLPGVDVSQETSLLQGALTPIQQLQVRPTSVLRQDALAVFDRTFAITAALQLLATVVAFAGVLSALMLLQIERQREFGILRAIGLTVRQLFGMEMLETGLMGAAAGLLAMPTGFALSLILIYIINRRSFGWTIQMVITPGPFGQALAVALAAALLAGIYPAFRLGRLMAAEAIRYE